MISFVEIGEPVPLRPETIAVTGCIRNEMLRLPDFLAHHRGLGADAFYLVDNMSTDGSAEYLSAQPDVCLFRTDEPYSASNCGVTWTNSILDEYLTGNWVLILDADEHFIYPGYENRSLFDLASWLEAEGTDAIVAPMLDMYAEQPISQTDYESGQSLLETCPYFDGKGYVTAPAANGKPVLSRGGPRHRLFWENKDRKFPSPYLTKIPFVRWSDGHTLTASTHILNKAVPSQITGLLLHFKLLQDFRESAESESGRAEHFMGARQYQAYHDILSTEPELRAYWSGSTRFRDSNQLVELGYMHAPDAWLSL